MKSPTVFFLSLFCGWYACAESITAKADAGPHPPVTSVAADLPILLSAPHAIDPVI